MTPEQIYRANLENALERLIRIVEGLHPDTLTADQRGALIAAQNILLSGAPDA